MRLAFLSIFLLGTAQGSPLFFNLLNPFPKPSDVLGMMSDVAKDLKDVAVKLGGLLPGKHDNSDSGNKQTGGTETDNNRSQGQPQRNRQEKREDNEAGLLDGISPLSAVNDVMSYMGNMRSSRDAESKIWENPCDYGSAPTTADAYSPKQAAALAGLAKTALRSTLEYKDRIAKVHSYKSFDKLAPVWTDYDWLRKFPWFQDDALPKAKVLGQNLPDDFMSGLMGRIDQALPNMYMGLKMIIAGLHTMSAKALEEGQVRGNEDLRPDIDKTVHNVRAVLCSLEDLLRARKLPVKPLPAAPEVQPDKPTFILLVYRDTLNDLEYLIQVFQKMSEMQK